MPLPSLQGFSPRKAAQVAAFFALRHGGAINILKLVKLIYLADREFTANFDRPILFDRFVSMPHGPVNSLTYNAINGYSSDPESRDQFVSDRANHKVGLTRATLSVDDLDELSEAELEVLELVWTRFGKMAPNDLVEYTHAHCPEWEDPHGSSEPIPYERVFKFLNRENSKALDANVQELRALDIAAE